jgi:hypothetical protein
MFLLFLFLREVTIKTYEIKPPEFRLPMTGSRVKVK